MILILGVTLWATAHLFVVLGGQARAAWIARLGRGAYRGLFSLVIVAALVLMVIGWRAAPTTVLWHPPMGLRHLTLGLMPLAVILFLASRMPTDVKRVIRHPQLTAVKLWAVLHLLSNADVRSVILFGGMLAWAVAQVIVTNRRDGAWNRPAPQGALKTTISTGVALLVTALLAWGHPWFAGMPLMALPG